MTKQAHAAVGFLAGAVTAATLTLATVQTPAPRETEREKPGVERWAAKTGGLPGDAKINLTPVTTTLHALVSLPRPAAADGAARVPPVETTCYVLHATLTAYREETDGDEHLALADGEETMIAEVPRPDFLPAACPWKARITNTRTAFVARFHPSARFQETNTPVTVTGIGFFDHPHGQRGAAPNAIEIHPVLGFEAGP